MRTLHELDPKWTMSPSTNQNPDSKLAAKQGVASDPSKIAA